MHSVSDETDEAKAPHAVHDITPCLKWNGCETVGRGVWKLVQLWQQWIIMSMALHGSKRKPVRGLRYANDMQIISDNYIYIYYIKCVKWLGQMHTDPEKKLRIDGQSKPFTLSWGHILLQGARVSQIPLRWSSGQFKHASRIRKVAVLCCTFHIILLYTFFIQYFFKKIERLTWQNFCRQCYASGGTWIMDLHDFIWIFTVPYVLQSWHLLASCPQCHSINCMPSFGVGVSDRMEHMFELHLIQSLGGQIETFHREIMGHRL